MVSLSDARACAPCVVDTEEALPRLRVVDARLHAILDEGAFRSPTLRGLIEEIQHSDLIVHVRFEPVRAKADGTLRFATAAGMVRFVRISIRPGVPAHALAALMGHELAHAVEIARDTGVRDQRSVRMLYERIGLRRTPDAAHFDTIFAVETGRRIQRELLRVTAGTWLRWPPTCRTRGRTRDSIRRSCDP